MAVNSKVKGDTYERKIAKKLTEWTGLKFERVPASGGLHWREDNRVYGDVVTNDPDFPFVIELKNRESWKMDSLINGSKEVEKWWKQVTADAEATGKEPMVIFSRNRQPDYIMIKTESFADDHVQLRGEDDLFFWLAITICGECGHIFKLEEFMEKTAINI